MIKISVTNERLLNFYNNAQFVIRQLSGTGKRTKYLGSLQLISEHFEPNVKALQKKLNRLEQKFAKTKESGEFIYTGEGENRTYSYTKEEREKYEDELEKLLNEVKELEVDPIYYLEEKDLPHEKDVCVMTNGLVKVFKNFVISEEVANKLLYPGIELNKESKLAVK